MNVSKSKRYLLKFSHNQSDHVAPVSEVPLANGIIAYVVKMQYYKGLFLKNGLEWTVKSKDLLPAGLKNQIINALLRHQCNLNLINGNKPGMWALQ